MEMKRISGSTARAVASATHRSMPVRTLQSQVVDQLGIAIVGGEFLPGATLPTDAALQDRFGVSRTVLREALKALAAKNLLTSRARIGTVVLPRRDWSLFDPDVLAWHFETGPDIAFLRSLAEIRIGLELESVALAAERRSDDQLALMLACVDGMAAARDTAEFARSDLAFHRAVAEASGNPFMASITGLVDLVLATAFTISSPVEDGEARNVTVDNHRRIATAIGTRDAEGARAAMRIVIMEGFDRAAGRTSGSAAG
jgi:DNA-binding FadR family transcriptional regulator